MTVHLTGKSGAGIGTGGIALASLMRKVLYASVFASIIAFIAYTITTQLSPRYRAETTILIDTGDLRSKGIAVARSAGSGLDQEVVAAQLQLLRSRDLARTVIQTLGLQHRPAFVSAVDGGSVATGVLAGIGLRRDPMRTSPEERLLETFESHLSLFAIDDAPVMAVAFASGDPQLAADVANAVAGEYVALQQAAAGGMDAGATSRLEADIASLGSRVAATEAKIAAYSAGIDQLAGSGPLAADLTRQQRAEAQLRSDLTALEDEAGRQRALLDSYVRRYREVLARRQGGFLPVDARILSRASAPIAPYFPQKGPITAIVGALAFLLMMVFVGVRALGRGQRQRVAEVPLPEVADAAPAVGNARASDDRGVGRMMLPTPTYADTGGAGPAGDSVATVAKRLISMQAKRVMVVTAAEEVGNRRPLTAVALARALARADRRPVLIDLQHDGADSLSMGETCGLPGFSDLFAGDASFGQVIFRDRKSRVHFIPSGLRRLRRQDLADAHVGLLVNALDHTYDHVVFDVAGDFVQAIASECDVALVATEFDRDDPRTLRLIELVRAHSPARIVVFRLDPSEATEAAGPPVEQTLGGAAA